MDSTDNVTIKDEPLNIHPEPTKKDYDDQIEVTIKEEPLEIHPKQEMYSTEKDYDDQIDGTIKKILTMK